MEQILFKYGLKADYLSLEVYDEYTLYWCLDTQELYKGNLLFAVGKEASTSSAGLLSAADKIKLDALTGGPINFKGVYDTLETIDFAPVNGDFIIIGTKEYVYSNGEWKEFGDESAYLTKAEAEANYLTKADAELAHSKFDAKIKNLTVGETKFEIISAVENYRVSVSQNDMRIYIPTDSQYQLQNGNGDPSMYYMHVRAWAPVDGVTSCKKGDPNYYERDFVDMEDIAVDPISGRVYEDFWLPIAYTQDGGVTWTSYADMSNDKHYMGFDWMIEWYNGETLVATASKRFTLTADMKALYNNRDFYTIDVENSLNEFKTQTNNSISNLTEAISWAPIV